MSDMSIEYSIDYLYSYENGCGDSLIFLLGWIDMPPNTYLMVQVDEEKPILIEPYFYRRIDVEDKVGRAKNVNKNGHGFCIIRNIENCSGKKTRILCANVKNGTVNASVLGIIKPKASSSINKFLTKISDTPIQEYIYAHIMNIYAKEIENNKKREIDINNKLPLITKKIGHNPDNPETSAIIVIHENINAFYNLYLKISEQKKYYKDFEIICILNDQLLTNDIIIALNNLYSITNMPCELMIAHIGSGLGSLYNEGIRHSKGKYLAIVDETFYTNDDKWLKYSIENYKNQNNIGILTTSLNDINGENVPQNISPLHDSIFNAWLNNEKIYKSEKYARDNKTHDLVIFNNCIISKELIEIISGFDEYVLTKLYLCWDICIRVLRTDRNIEIMNDIQGTIINSNKNVYKHKYMQLRHPLTIYSDAIYLRSKFGDEFMRH